MMTDDLESCEHHCNILLREGKERDPAGVMMADVLFKKKQYEKATAYFQQLLVDKPNHYAGLARIVELLRRAGKLEECRRYLDTAEKASGRAAMEPGFNYCSGLYEWYAGNPNKALKLFNKVSLGFSLLMQFMML